MNNEIIQTINALAERLGVAVANTQPYAEDLCNRIITYTILDSVTCIVLFLGFAISAAIILPKWWKAEYNAYEDAKELFRIITSGSWIFITLILFVAACFSLSEICQCLTIPESVIIDKLLEVAG